MTNPTKLSPLKTVHLQCVSVEDGLAVFSGKPLVDTTFLWTVDDLKPFGVDPIEGMELDLTYRDVMRALPVFNRSTFIHEIVSFANVEIVWH